MRYLLRGLLKWLYKVEVEGRRYFYVRDNGIGIDMMYAHKSFKAFERLEVSGDYEGTGIGLAMTQRVVSRHGGRIWIESKRGQGATIYFGLDEPQSI